MVFENNVLHAAEPAPVDSIHTVRILARVFISVCGTVPLPAGVVERATPVLIFSRFVAVAKALAMSVVASALAELDTWVASEAKPAMDQAAAIVEISLTTTLEDVILSHVPSAARTPAAEFAPEPGLP